MHTNSVSFPSETIQHEAWIKVLYDIIPLSAPIRVIRG